MRFSFPDGMRPATVDEREEFYRTAFPTEAVAALMERWERFVPVVDIGTESTRYRPRYKEYKGKLVRITEFDDVDELREKIVAYAPEDLYYVTTDEKPDRVEVNPRQELVFDLDPEEAPCTQCERKRHYQDADVASYTFCMDCLTNVASQTRHLYTVLENNFDDLQLVYSGRGFHIHVRDDDAFAMPREDRQELAARIAKEFPIDAKVTAGETDLIRLPGSLHGLVSRVATPVTVADLSDPARVADQARPEFLDL